MAIDTAEKRRAVAWISFYHGGPGVTPNASQDAEWRQEAGWGYPGISVGAAPAAPDGAYQHITHCGAGPRRRLGGMNMCFMFWTL